MKSFLFLSTIVSTIVFAQDKADSISSANSVSSITIQTNIEGARVFVDGDSVGTTPLTFQATPGIHRVKIISPDVASWLSEPVVDSILVEPGAPRRFRYSFAQKILVISSPSEAEVVLGDSVIGTTPLVIRSESASLRLRKNGYEEAPLDSTNMRRGILSTRLKKIWQNEGGESDSPDSEVKRSTLKLYISGAATVLAGATSAYFKVRADNSYSDYVRTGDRAQLSEVNRLDTTAGIALAATQIGLGLFTYFILSE